LDIDAIYNHIWSGDPYSQQYDVNGDGRVNKLDVTYLLQNILHTNYGDATLDGRVNIDDFSVLLAHWGSSAGWAGGDFTGDGYVNIDDFSVLLANWGWSSGSDFSSMQTPEPTTLAFLALGGLTLLRRRR
jgi:hypothetical protein